MKRHRTVAAAITTSLLVGGTIALATASPANIPNLKAFANPTGDSHTFGADGQLPLDNPFFQSLGTNGRACVHCHQPGEGWGITPAGVQARFEATEGLDPIFRTNDGSNSPLADVSTVEARRQAYSMLLNKGLIRVGIGVPAGAEFTLTAVDDPYGYAHVGELSLFRRPLPSTNLRYMTAIMWDGRQSPAGRSMEDNLIEQARGATLGHAEAATSPTDAQLREIVRFETGLFTAQCRDSDCGQLHSQGAKGGAQVLAKVPFHPGINDPILPDPSGQPSTPIVMTLFDGWSRDSRKSAQAVRRQAVVRGQALFNSRQFAITGVSGLNDELGQPLIMGTCSTCHNTPNVGNHSMPRALDIGLTDASLRTPDMPLYTLRNNTTGEIRLTTDPGRALITGKWKDVGRFKGAVLRGLAARAPYFHNGLAASLMDVVDFYDSRFSMGLTAQEKADLVAFMRSL